MIRGLLRDCETLNFARLHFQLYSGVWWEMWRAVFVCIKRSRDPAPTQQSPAPSRAQPAAPFTLSSSAQNTTTFITSHYNWRQICWNVPYFRLLRARTWTWRSATLRFLTTIWRSATLMFPTSTSMFLISNLLCNPSSYPL